LDSDSQEAGLVQDKHSYNEIKHTSIHCLVNDVIKASLFADDEYGFNNLFFPN